MKTNEMTRDYRIEVEITKRGKDRWHVTRWAERIGADEDEDEAAGPPTVGGFGKHHTVHRSEKAAKAAAARWLDKLEI